MFLTAGGILLLGTGVFLGFAALLALGAAGPAPDPAVVAHHARFWAQMRYLLTDPGLMAWGVGLLLYGGLLWRSGALPRSVVAICLAGGVAGVLTLAVFETSILALDQLVAFAVLGLGAGVSLLRESRGTAGAPAPSPRQTLRPGSTPDTRPWTARSSTRSIHGEPAAKHCNGSLRTIRPPRSRCEFA